MWRRVCDLVLVVGVPVVIVLAIWGADDLKYVAQHPYQEADVKNAAQQAFDHCIGDPCLS